MHFVKSDKERSGLRDCKDALHDTNPDNLQSIQLSPQWNGLRETKIAILLDLDKSLSEKR